MIVVLGLTSALLYGVSDHFGGLASRTRPATRVAALALLVSTVVALPALAVGTAVWSPAAVGWAAGAGAAGGIGVPLLYRGLAAGPVGFVSPGVALLTGGLPVLWSVATGERLAPGALLALAAIVVGGVLIGAEPDARRRPAPATVLLVVTTGVLYGAYFVLMHRTPADSGAVPLVVESATAAAVVGLVQLARRGREGAGAPGPRGAVLAAGVTQGVAGVLLVFALHLPGLAVVAALSSLYPVTTVLLAVVVLRERIRPHQVAGLIVAIGGVGALALLRG